MGLCCRGGCTIGATQVTVGPMVGRMVGDVSSGSSSKLTARTVTAPLLPVVDAQSVRPRPPERQPAGPVEPGRPGDADPVQPLSLQQQTVARPPFQRRFEHSLWPE